MAPYDGGGTVELSEFWLRAGGSRVDAAATLTSTIAPLAGSLADLKDDDTATAVSINRKTVLQWDFGGSPQDVTDIRLGAAGDEKKFLLAVRIEWSDDGAAWAPAHAFAGILFPGARTMTQSARMTPRLAAAGATVLQDNSLSAMTLPLPALSGEYPTTLVAAVMFRATPGAPPAGWTRVSTAGPALLTADSLTQWSEVYIRSVAAPSDAVAPTFTQAANGRMSGVIMEVACSFATAAVESEQTAVVSNTTTVTVALPSLTAAGDGLAVGVASAILSLASGAQAVSVTVPWVLRSTTPVAALRLGVATQTLSSGGNTAGTMTWESLTPSGNGTTANALILVGPEQIRRSPFVSAVLGGATANSLGATPSPMRAVQEGVVRARPNYLFDPKSRGRVRGVVLMHVGGVNKPVFRRVMLIRERDMLVVGMQWSDPLTGAYDFQYVEDNEAYTVLSHDYTHDKRAVIADGITLANGKLELMP
ncbi:hypothetical protein [Variovorax boronicumulans]|uniref:hypothetical protein n=1 Tax=Variovorax boronicumulans TaxID=436515 RepID=UPI0012FE5787|nr:hypothetical protein [Variovorax boronicumulans]